jgi:hypothetical protein
MTDRLHYIVNRFKDLCPEKLARILIEKKLTKKCNFFLFYLFKSIFLQTIFLKISKIYKEV